MINIQNLTNIYEQQAARRNKIIIKAVKIALFIVVAPVVAYLFGSFVFTSFNPVDWTQYGRVNTLFIAIVLWLLSLFTLIFNW